MGARSAWRAVGQWHGVSSVAACLSRCGSDSLSSFAVKCSKPKLMEGKEMISIFKEAKGLGYAPPPTLFPTTNGYNEEDHNFLFSFVLRADQTTKWKARKSTSGELKELLLFYLPQTRFLP